MDEICIFEPLETACLLWKAISSRCSLVFHCIVNGLLLFDTRSPDVRACRGFNLSVNLFSSYFLPVFLYLCPIFFDIFHPFNGITPYFQRPNYLIFQLSLLNSTSATPALQASPHTPPRPRTHTRLPAFSFSTYTLPSIQAAFLVCSCTFAKSCMRFLFSHPQLITRTSCNTPSWPCASGRGKTSTWPCNPICTTHSRTCSLCRVQSPSPASLCAHRRPPERP